MIFQTSNNGILDFFIDDATAQGIFYINSQGAISPRRQLDRLPQDRYEVCWRLPVLAQACVKIHFYVLYSYSTTFTNCNEFETSLVQREIQGTDNLNLGEISAQQ